MLKDAIVRFDTKVTSTIRRWPRWLRAPMLTVTTIAQPVVMGLVAMIVGVIAWQHSQTQTAYIISAALLAMMANSVLKHYVHRPRPDTLYVSRMYFKTSSFPSGHSFGATIICGVLVYLSAVYLGSPWAVAAPIGLIALAIGVGLSRIYLGAHFPTDVIAGWALGGVAAVIIIVYFHPL
jgi:undecaprenyl-diphosphatase